jgi:CHAT domain-containing protein
LARAHELYHSLFGQVEELIKDKHLLVVASGALTALPFQVLVTEKPASAIPANSAAYANAAWLAKRHAITVLPSVASIKALRQFAKASKATQPFIGFGNPLLTGPNGMDRRAWDRHSCGAPSVTVKVASRRVRSGIPKFSRNGLANVEEVRAQHPLPETADELCAVANSTGVGERGVFLGEKATEANIKALSANGALASARVVHFATHGLLAGETKELAASRAEPSLILTPPERPTEEDDGLLTASEIAQLKLDADWVVLSACNTASAESDKLGAEALSGLARAFFYAGARALLVSHWAVNSEATVRLITKAFDELKANPNLGRAQALQRSMLSLIHSGDGYAHPANWAPFVVVGEGAAR